MVDYEQFERSVAQLIAELKATEKGYSDQVDSLIKQSEADRENLYMAAEQKAKLETQLAKHKELIERYKIELEKLREVTRKARNQRDALGKELETVKKENAELLLIREKNSKLRKQVEELQQQLAEHTNDKSRHRNNLTNSDRQNGINTIKQNSINKEVEIVKAIQLFVANRQEYKVDMVQIMNKCDVSDFKIRETIKKVAAGELKVPTTQEYNYFWAWFNAGHKFYNTPIR